MKFKDSGTAKLILIVASLGLTIGLGEVTSRLIYFVHGHGHLYEMNSHEYSLPLGWQLVRGTHLDFHINQQGFRHPQDVTLQPQPDTIRIFLVGGSTAFGNEGVYRQVNPPRLTDRDTIDYHLQAILTARHPEVRFEVINAAVSEYRLFQEITLFREKLVNFQPQLVIFLDGHNDISFLTAGAALADDPNPYWDNRHFMRAQRVLNSSSGLAPLYYLDLYLGRASYFYHGLSSVLQRASETPFMAKAQAFESTNSWGNRPFRLADEVSIKEQYKDKLRELDKALPLYIDQVKDLRAIGGERKINIVYALQPEIVMEDPADLTAKEKTIQQIAFEHHRNLGTLSWRYLTTKIAGILATFESDEFEFVDLVTVARKNTDDKYTDYCHLTSQGNRLVAEKLYPAVHRLLGL